MLQIDSSQINILPRGTQAVAKAIRRFGKESFYEAFRQYSIAIRKVFEAEGPGWAPLSPYTIRMRRLAGFPPGPILRRTGSLYRSLSVQDMGQQTMASPDLNITAGFGGPALETPEVPMGGWETGGPITTGNETTEIAAGADHQWTFTILDERFLLNQEGGMVGKNVVPARHMLPEGAALAEMNRLMELNLVFVLENEMLHHELKPFNRGDYGSDLYDMLGTDAIWRRRSNRSFRWSTIKTPWSEAPWF
jgi:hypothetical protein